MKNLKHIFGTLIVAVLLLTSCETSDDSDPIIDVPSAEDYANLKAEALENRTQTFQFDAEDGWVNFTSDNGVVIGISGSCLTQNGNAITGQVDIDYVELFSKGDMLVTNKPTMGVLPGGDKALLISGGEFFIEATQNGTPLDITCPVQLQVPSSLTGGTDNEMTLWTGTIDENDNLDWDPAEDVTGQGGVFAEGNQYYAFINEFGWTNIDRFYNDPRPKTTILVQAPDGYDYTNSSVFLSYDGEDSGLAALDTFESGMFSEHYGQIPVGLECHVIFMTEEDGNFRYAIKAVTIAADDVIVFTLAETLITTESGLVSLINGLP